MAHPALSYGAGDETVDDSEPERAELRKKHRKNSSWKSDNNEHESDVEMASIPPLPLKPLIPEQKSIEISDDSDLELLTTPKLPRKTVPLNERIPRIPGVLTSSTTAFLREKRTTSAVQNAAKKFDIDCFAFKNADVARKKVIPPMPASKLPGVNQNIEPKLVSNTRAILSIPTSDLSKVFRCVCCDLSWTARKTGIQKMAHIRSCSKKNGYSDDIVQALLLKEVANYAPVPGQNKDKIKELDPQDSPSKKTYMENILSGDKKTKTKTKTKHIPTHLTKVTAARASILERAQAILASGDADTGSEALVHNEDEHSHMIQDFGLSALGQQQGTILPVFFSATHDAPLRSPRSALGLNDESLTSDSDHFSGSDDELRPIPLREVGMNHDIQSTSVLNVSDSSTNNQHNLNDHLLAHDVSKSLMLPKPHKTPKPREKTGQSPVKRARAPGTPTKTKKFIHSFNEKWESHMAEHILQDTNLHLRILRYEPIDFNVFLELAEKYAPVNGRLKTHLRKYLDNKAIHFYDASRS